MLESEQPREGELGAAPLTRAESFYNVTSLLHPSAVLRHLRTPLYANAYYLMANTAVLSLSGFIFWTLAAKLYDPAEVGLGSALVAAWTLLVSISVLGLGTGLIRLLPTAQNAWSLTGVSLTMAALVSVLASAVFLMGIGFWAPDLGFVSQQPGLVISFVMFAAAGTVSAILDSVFVAWRTAQYTLLKNIATSLGRIPLLLLVASFAGPFAILGAIGIVTLPVAGVAIWWAGRQTRRLASTAGHTGQRTIRRLIRFSAVNHVADLVYRLPSMVLPLLVLNVLGPESNGYFYMSWMVGSFLSVIPSAMSLSLFAEGSHSEATSRALVLRAMASTLILVVAAGILLLVLGGRVLLVFGEAYAEEGAGLLRLVALAAVPMTVSSAYMMVERVQDRLTPVLGLSAVIAVGTLGLSHFLLPTLGLNGVGAAWLASQGTAAVISGVLLCRRQWLGALPSEEEYAS